MSEKLKVLSLFSGIGAFEKALTKLNIGIDIKGTAEWDVNAIISYDAIHTDDGVDFTKGMNKEEILEKLNKFNFSTDGKKPCNLSRLNNKKLRQLYNANLRSKNLGDVSLVDYSSINNVDLVVGGSPCQSFSIAGFQKGSMWTCKDCNIEYNPLEQHYTKRNKCINCNSENIDKTTSSLIVEYLRAIRENKPKYLAYENVKNIISKKFKKGFEIFENELNEYGYNTYWKALNSKNFGTPQSRDRIYLIGILKEHDKKDFEWPEPFDNGVRLKHILEENVDEKYYINDARAEKLLSELKPNGKQVSHCFRSRKFSGFKDIAPNLCARDYKDPKNIVEEQNIEPQVLRYERTEYGKAIRKDYESGKIDEKIGNMRTAQPRIDGVSNTLTSVQKDNMVAIPCITPDRPEKRQNGRRFKEDGEPMFTITSQDRHGILQIEMPQTVKVRKHEVDIEGLKKCLKEHKHLSNDQMSVILNVKKTTVEHWFRTDKYFSIPDAEIWDNLKFILGIKTDKFDKSIMEFEEKEGVYEKSNRYYSEEGVCPTVTTSDNHKIIQSKNEEKEKQYEENAPTLRGNCGGLKLAEPNECIQSHKLCGEKYDKMHDVSRRVYSENGIAPTMHTCQGGNTEPKVETNYRIRKLTEREALRLMDFDDEDIDKIIAADVSRSQMYKLAGNSIVCGTLNCIFKNLFKNTNYI